MPNKQSSIIVVGAGVLGLSTAIGLLESGYENVTILDQQDFEASEYSPFRGADSASADTLKVIRSAYGGASLHHALATEAISAWKSWNAEAGRDLFVNCGWTRMSSTGSLAAADVATLDTMAAAGQGASQYRLGDAAERLRAQKDGWPTTKVDPFGRLGRSQVPAFDGVFDTLAGFVHASHACVFALRKAKQLGATVVFGQAAGRVDEILYAPLAGSDGGIAAGVVTGVRTADGIEHRSDIVIVAAGARTHMLVPELVPFVTASGANIIHVRVPPALQPKFHSDVFPVFSWGYTGFDEDGGLSGFPLDENGTLKFLHRSPKWTNPSTPPAPATASVTSCPTAWSLSAKTNVPKSVVDTVKAFIADNIPELVDCEILMAKLCWDSFTVNLDFVMDWVPRRGNLLVVAGGSGHGFKFLPTLGKYVVKVLEGRSDKYTELWKWADLEEGKKAKFAAFMLDPEHRLDQQQMATASDLEWGTEP